jgi:ADP-heptose:LPS heptosyltransferase
MLEIVGGGVQNLVGKTALHEFVDAIAAAALVICNDSSAFHIAMALQKRVICILGGGHFGWFAPYPPGHPSSPTARVLSYPMECFWCNWVCKYPRGSGGAFRCVDSIPVRAAIDSLESLLN